MLDPPDEQMALRLRELEIRLRDAWSCVDELSREYLTLWERLERVEFLLFMQQNIIFQLTTIAEEEELASLTAASITCNLNRSGHLRSFLTSPSSSSLTHQIEHPHPHLPQLTSSDEEREELLASLAAVDAELAIASALAKGDHHHHQHHHLHGIIGDVGDVAGAIVDYLNEEDASKRQKHALDAKKRVKDEDDVHKLNVVQRKITESDCNTHPPDAASAFDYEASASPCAGGSSVNATCSSSPFARPSLASSSATRSGVSSSSSPSRSKLHQADVTSSSNLFYASSLPETLSHVDQSWVFRPSVIQSVRPKRRRRKDLGKDEITSFTLGTSVASEQQLQQQQMLQQQLQQQLHKRSAKQVSPRRKDDEHRSSSHSHSEQSIQWVQEKDKQSLVPPPSSSEGQGEEISQKCDPTSVLSPPSPPPAAVSIDASTIATGSNRSGQLQQSIFSASDYMEYRGSSSCVSDQEIEQLDALSSTLDQMNVPPPPPTPQQSQQQQQQSQGVNLLGQSNRAGDMASRSRVKSTSSITTGAIARTKVHESIIGITPGPGQGKYQEMTCIIDLPTKERRGFSLAQDKMPPSSSPSSSGSHLKKGPPERDERLPGSILTSSLGMQVGVDDTLASYQRQQQNNARQEENAVRGLNTKCGQSLICKLPNEYSDCDFGSSQLASLPPFSSTCLLSEKSKKSRGNFDITSLDEATYERSSETLGRSGHSFNSMQINLPSDQFNALASSVSYFGQLEEGGERDSATKAATSTTTPTMALATTSDSSPCSSEKSVNEVHHRYQARKRAFKVVKELTIDLSGEEGASNVPRPSHQGHEEQEDEQDEEEEEEEEAIMSPGTLDAGTMSASDQLQMMMMMITSNESTTSVPESSESSPGRESVIEFPQTTALPELSSPSVHYSLSSCASQINLQSDSSSNLFNIHQQATSVIDSSHTASSSSPSSSTLLTLTANSNEQKQLRQKQEQSKETFQVDNSNCSSSLMSQCTNYISNLGADGVNVRISSSNVSNYISQLKNDHKRLTESPVCPFEMDNNDVTKVDSVKFTSSSSPSSETGTQKSLNLKSINQLTTQSTRDGSTIDDSNVMDGTSVPMDTLSMVNVGQVVSSPNGQLVKSSEGPVHSADGKENTFVTTNNANVTPGAVDSRTSGHLFGQSTVKFDESCHAINDEITFGHQVTSRSNINATSSTLPPHTHSSLPQQQQQHHPLPPSSPSLLTTFTSSVSSVLNAPATANMFGIQKDRSDSRRESAGSLASSIGGFLGGLGLKSTGSSGTSSHSPRHGQHILKPSFSTTTAVADGKKKGYPQQQYSLPEFTTEEATTASGDLDGNLLNQQAKSPGQQLNRESNLIQRQILSGRKVAGPGEAETDLTCSGVSTLSTSANRQQQLQQQQQQQQQIQQQLQANQYLMPTDSSRKRGSRGEVLDPVTGLPMEKSFSEESSAKSGDSRQSSFIQSEYGSMEETEVTCDLAGPASQVSSSIEKRTDDDSAVCSEKVDETEQSLTSSSISPLPSTAATASGGSSVMAPAVAKVLTATSTATPAVATLAASTSTPATADAPGQLTLCQSANVPSNESNDDSTGPSKTPKTPQLASLVQTSFGKEPSQSPGFQNRFAFIMKQKVEERKQAANTSITSSTSMSESTSFQLPKEPQQQQPEHQLMRESTEEEPSISFSSTLDESSESELKNAKGKKKWMVAVVG